MTTYFGRYKVFPNVSIRYIIDHTIGTIDTTMGQLLLCMIPLDLSQLQHCLTSFLRFLLSRNITN